jgi:hypothetical protein
MAQSRSPAIFAGDDSNSKPVHLLLEHSALRSTPDYLPLHRRSRLLGDLPDGEPNDSKWIAAIGLKLARVDGQRKTKRVVDSNLLLSADGSHSSIEEIRVGRSLR